LGRRTAANTFIILVLIASAQPAQAFGLKGLLTRAGAGSLGTCHKGREGRRHVITIIVIDAVEVAA
jgi:hypothetical protein